MRFRGHEMAHKDIEFELLNRMIEELADISTVELQPKAEGRQMIMVLAPGGSGE